MRKIIIFIFLILFYTLSVSANSLDFVWEKNPEWKLEWENKIKIEEKINELQQKYGLNIDIVILWANDEKKCYSVNSYDTCLVKSYFFNADLLIGIKMKSAYSDRWDIRSLIKNDYLQVISTLTLKNIQDDIIYNFKKEDFSKWILEYLNILDSKIHNTCIKISDWKKCEIQSLVVASEWYKTKILLQKWIFLIIFILFIWWGFYWRRRSYMKKLKNLFKDIKYYLLELENIEMFEIDKKDIIKELNIIHKLLENYLWNLDKSTSIIMKYYVEKKKDFEIIQEKTHILMQKYTSQEKLRSEVNEIKSINL